MGRGKPRPYFQVGDMAKKRILFTGEASFLSTGFATFNREIMRRLHATGKYEIAEMGSYATQDDPRVKDLPWKFYGVLPQNEQEKQAYDGNPTNAFGKYKIDGVLADFQPDIVYDLRDPWMMSHLVDARFRSNYKLVLTPTVDSAPQKAEWIKGIFEKADAVTAYSRYGKRVLEKDGVKVLGVTSPGVHLETFKPLDKLAVRDKFHITPTLLLFGTVMRNQKRKLFPDLFDAYKRLRDRVASPSLVKRAKKKVREKKKLSKSEKAALRIDHSALLCHTSWPDLGWNLPDYLKRFQLQRHVIFTYKCEECKEVYAAWFTPSDQQGLCVCRVCGKKAAHMPSTHSGISEEKLVEVFNLIDIYIQPAICEGWGLPIMESKACGVPGLYQNYSAMEDHVENGGGMPIKIHRYYHESETSAVRSLPDIDDLSNKMERLALNEKMRKSMGREARQCAEKMHDWDVTAKKLEKLFDELEIHDRTETWDKYPKFEYINPQRPPAGLNDQQFVVWCYINILHRKPDDKGFQDWMGSLAKGAPREEVESYFRHLVAANNKFEEVRWNNSLRNRGMAGEVASEVEVEEEDMVPGVIL